MEGLRPGWAVKAIIVIVISSVLFRCVSATTNHSVGGPTVFRYRPTHDVLEVHEADYPTCRITDPIRAYSDGETVVQLEEGGISRYFICGRLNYCARGLKLEVQVLLRLSPPPSSSPPNPNPNPNPNGTTITPSAGGDGSTIDGHRRGRPRPPDHGRQRHPPPPLTSNSTKSSPRHHDHDHDRDLPPSVDDHGRNGHDKCAPAPHGQCSGGVELGIGFFLRCCFCMLPLIAALAASIF
ncbi:hypothetical protein TEA_028134 [Camellia sinensis var. sinensis]|uniref:Phytocyanin domain-containing protein n=1 Tax=Camellia sinensis var. sinensis TaxID=542762 RepID=A0A4S4E2I9_CAMSN|nr:hypothetical protein TEA_028134 [Camellia sinensis var. sinensis]